MRHRILALALFALVLGNAPLHAASLHTPRLQSVSLRQHPADFTQRGPALHDAALSVPAPQAPEAFNGPVRVSVFTYLINLLRGLVGR